MGARGVIGTGELLLSRFKGRALKLCVHLGLTMSALALLPAIASTDDRGRRVAAVAFTLVCWVAAEYYRKRSNWVPDVLADRRWVLAAAALAAVPFAIDGHAQSDAFMGIAPLAGIAAIACRRREVILFTGILIAAYVAGGMSGGGGLDVVIDADHPFDSVQQIAAIGACCGLFAFAVLWFRRFIEQIPSVVAATNRRRFDVETKSGIEPLTERERQVIGLFSRGQTRAEIARSLFIAEGTVKTHFDNIEAKFGVSSQEEALAIYLKNYDTDG